MPARAVDCAPLASPGGAMRQGAARERISCPGAVGRAAAESRRDRANSEPGMGSVAGAAGVCPGVAVEVPGNTYCAQPTTRENGLCAEGDQTCFSGEDYVQPKERLHHEPWAL